MSSLGPVFTLVNVYVDMLVFTRKHAICLKDYRLQSCLSIQYVHDPDRYSNLFLNAYINRKKNLFYSPLGICHFLYIVLTPISTTSGL